MAETIKGLELKISADTQQFDQALKLLNKELMLTEKTTRELAEEQDRLSVKQQYNRERARELAGEYEKWQKAAAEAGKTTKELTKSLSQLSSAYEEQEKNGQLSLETALKLIDAGYASALVIDEETGAVYLDAQAYERLTAAKYAEQIATLEAARATLVTRLEGERQAAMLVGDAFMYAAAAKQIYDTESGIGDIDAQIALLKGVSSGKIPTGKSGGGSPKKSGGSSGKSSKKETDPLADAYAAETKSLKLARDAGIITEEEYNTKLLALQEKRLSQLKEGTDDYLEVLSGVNATKKAISDAELKDETDKLKAAADAYAEFNVYLKLLYDAGIIDEQEYNDSRREKRRERMAELAEDSNEYLALLAEVLAEERAAHKAAYDKQRSDLDYRRSMGMVSDKAYYDEVARLRDEFLEEDTDAWRRANIEIFNFRRKMQEEELLARQRAFDAIGAKYQRKIDNELGQLKKYYEERKKFIDDDVAAEKSRMEAIIASVDAQIKKRRELRQDEQEEDKVARIQKKLTAAQAELTYARDDEERKRILEEIYRVEQELAKAQQERGDTLFYRAKEQEKVNAKAAYEAAVADAARLKEELEKEHKDAAFRAEGDLAVEMRREYAQAYGWDKDKSGGVAASSPTGTAAIAAASAAIGGSMNNTYNTDARAYSPTVNVTQQYAQPVSVIVRAVGRALTEELA